MNKRKWSLAAGIGMALIVGALAIPQSLAQMPGFKRTELQKHDVSTPGHEAVVAKGEFEPGVSIPKHTHPGEEFAYVPEGELSLDIAGKAQTVKAGDTYFVPAGTVHSAKNTAKGKTVVLSTYVVEKGKPLATPVP